MKLLGLLFLKATINEYNSSPTDPTGVPEVCESHREICKRKRKRRKAAISSEQKTKALLDSE